jgi:hypothetical protein
MGKEVLPVKNVVICLADSPNRLGLFCQRDKSEIRLCAAHAEPYATEPSERSIVVGASIHVTRSENLSKEELEELGCWCLRGGGSMEEKHPLDLVSARPTAFTRSPEGVR